jgi:quinol monooxygenase YgiN
LNSKIIALLFFQTFCHFPQIKYRMSLAVDVVVTLRFKAGHVEEALEAFRKCQSLTRLEAGCIFYNLWVDKATEALEEGERVFYLLEKWADQSSLDLHLKQPHVVELIAKLGQFAASTKMSVCRFVQ